MLHLAKVTRIVCNKWIKCCVQLVPFRNVLIIISTFSFFLFYYMFSTKIYFSMRCALTKYVNYQKKKSFSFVNINAVIMVKQQLDLPDRNVCFSLQQWLRSPSRRRIEQLCTCLQQKKKKKEINNFKFKFFSIKSRIYF